MADVSMHDSCFHQLQHWQSELQALLYSQVAVAGLAPLLVDATARALHALAIIGLAKHREPAKGAVGVPGGGGIAKGGLGDALAVPVLVAELAREARHLAVLHRALGAVIGAGLAAALLVVVAVAAVGAPLVLLEPGALLARVIGAAAGAGHAVALGMEEPAVGAVTALPLVVAIHAALLALLTAMGSNTCSREGSKWGEMKSVTSD